MIHLALRKSPAQPPFPHTGVEPTGRDSILGGLSERPGCANCHPQRTCLTPLDPRPTAAVPDGSFSSSSSAAGGGKAFPGAGPDVVIAARAPMVPYGTELGRDPAPLVAITAGAAADEQWGPASLPGSLDPDHQRPPGGARGGTTVVTERHSPPVDFGYTQSTPRRDHGTGGPIPTG